MNNLDKLIYTYKHRKIVDYLAHKYTNNEELFEQVKKHDLDKMYLLLFYDKKSIGKFHRSVSNHHDNDLEKSKIDYMEMVLDWESARYTKPDKPLNAYDTLYKYYPELEAKIMPILKEFGIDKSNLPMEEDVLKYTKSLDKITEKDIKNELIKFIEEYQ